jgi:type IV pilus assembly protein PilY1
MKTQTKKTVLRWLVSSVLMTLGSASFAAPGKLVDTPLSVEVTHTPMTMFVMSNDHQIYNKAYSDYSDLDGDGDLDTTYDDTIEYSGYFASSQCYAYNSISDRYQPVSLVTAGTHQCGGASDWSGNFLNWATMSRIDIIRHVLYGGLRDDDTETLTVLARASIPRDNHAFVKIFSSASMSDYTPYSNAVLSICNVSHSPESVSVVGGDTRKPGLPTMRIASGNAPGQIGWPRWGATERTQCTWFKDPDGTAHSDKSNGVLIDIRGRPSYDDDRITENRVHVEVCSTNVSGFNSAAEDSRCQYYDQGDADDTTGNYKPVGILQEYGEGGDVRFGLITGSYNRNKSGGVLRSPVKFMAGQDVATDDEINLLNGTFYHTQGANSVTNGIIETIDAFKIVEYGYNNNNIYRDCRFNRRTGFNDGQCRNWGNPISEMYLEALRYFHGGLAPTPAFNADDSAFFSELTQIETWTDPYEGNPCAKCNIVVISTGLNSFDTDQLGGFDDIVGTANGITSINTVLDTIIPNNESTGAVPFAGNYFIGENVTDSNKTCTPKLLSGLSSAVGGCPEEPALEGGFDIAGMAYVARANPIRTDIAKDQVVDTYAISLAESLPTFTLPVSGNDVSFVPVCQTNTLAGWLSCSLVDIIVTPTGNSQTGQFTIFWEDSSFGADADSDVVLDFDYCVGSACIPTVNTDEIRITVAWQAQSTPLEMRFGYSITGIGGFDGARIGLYKDANTWTYIDNNPTQIDLGSDISTSSGDSWEATYKAVAASGTASQTRTLENPLWYAAKYGGFNDSNGNGIPDLQSEWDAFNAKGDEVPDGIPDKYFPVSDPSQLGDSLSRLLEFSQEDNSQSAATFSSGRITTNTLLFQSLFDVEDWSGDLQAFALNDGGIVNPDAPVWSAATKLRAQAVGTRNILTYSNYNTDPATGAGVSFSFPSAYPTLSTTDISQAMVNDLLANKPTTITSAADVLAYGSDVVDFLKGDTTNELNRSGGTGLFRNRQDADDETQNNILGALVNSPPVYVYEPSENYPDAIEGTANLYSAFKPHIGSISRPPVVYVGSNDGMMHAFNASVDIIEDATATPPTETVTSNTNSGNELFAYIPSYLDNKLSDLTKINYASSIPYQSYVDGDITVRDVFIDDAWRTYLVGTTRTGGKGIYVLNVTDPDTMTSANVIGEFTHRDLGLTFSKPQIIKMNDSNSTGAGRWAAVFGNGYNNTGTGSAQLFIVFLDDLANPITIDTEKGNKDLSCEALVNNCNGLSTPTLADLDGDFIVDRIYAGDVQGNMWAFDVSSTDSDDWDVAFIDDPAKKQPLFTACSADCFDTAGNNINRQPITTAPQIQSHPTRGSFSTAPNVLVYFGTGQYIANNDNTATDIQSFYTVWDKGSGGKTRDNLQSRSFVADTDGSISINAGTQSGDLVVDYTAELGWYIDIAGPSVFLGGRTVIDSVLIGEIIFFVVSVPDSDAFSCKPGGTSYLVALDALDGKEPAFEVFPDSTDPSSFVQLFSQAVVGTGIILDSTGSPNLGITTADGGYEQNKIQVNTVISAGRISWSILK